MFEATTTIQSEHLTESQRASIVQVTEMIEKLNAAMRAAVSEGLSIELHRTSRCHEAGGYWGDIMKPQVVKWR